MRRTDSRQIDGRPIQLPMVDVHTVGAGGGSIGWRDRGGALRVGPRSAGAEPGPRLLRPRRHRADRHRRQPPARQPRRRLAAGGRRRARRRGGASRRRASSAAPLGLGALEAAEGIVRVANQEMVRALRVVTVERGLDPRRFALLPFGGAGPMHAAAIAAELGIERILCPRAGGVLSALGLCASDRRRDTARTVMLSGARAERRAHRRRGRRADRQAGRRASGGRRARGGLRDALRGPGLRAAGSRDRPTPTPPTWSSASSGPTRTSTATATPTARWSSSTSAWRWSRPGRAPRPARRRRAAPRRARARSASAASGSRRRCSAASPAAGTERRGPGRLRAARGDPRRAARLVAPRRRGRHDPGGGPTVGERSTRSRCRCSLGGLRAACDEMGAALIRSAYSANIKERHDCSTALFDAAGELVMQAEHIPVHLGSMPDAVAAVLGEPQRPGAPGSSTTPTAAAPTCPTSPWSRPSSSRGALTGFAACRAHHADVGGPTPGSMPADSSTLDEEGVVIPPTPADTHRLRELAAQMRFPEPAPRRPPRPAGRQPDRRPAPDRARRAPRARAAARRDGGDPRLRGAPHPGRAGGAARRLLRAPRTCSRTMPAASPATSRLRVVATIAGERLSLDFTGTDPQVEGNLNCPLSVTKSAAFFAVRVLTDPDAPPSAGAFRPIEVLAPEGCLLNARAPAAVVAGNTETSSRVADLVIAALGGRPAGPRPGPGDDEQPDPGRRGLHLLRDARRRPGRLPGADGPSAIHVAMSNTLNTPVEALETEFPLRVRELAMRRGSGGGGRHRGRRRDRARARGPGADALQPDRRAPPAPAAGSRRRRGRRAGPQHARTATRCRARPKATCVRRRLRIETPGGGGLG